MRKDPSDIYGKFSEKNYDFSAFTPKSGQENNEFLLKAESQGKELFQVRVPMLYAPMFGVDVGDSALLEHGANGTTVIQMVANEQNALSNCDERICSLDSPAQKTNDRSKPHFSSSFSSKTLVHNGASTLHKIMWRENVEDVTDAIISNLPNPQEFDVKFILPLEGKFGIKISASNQLGDSK